MINRANIETTSENPRRCTAFEGHRLIASGPLLEVAAATKAAVDADRSLPILIFDDVTSEQIEIDFRGSLETVLKRLRFTTPPPAAQTVDTAEKRGPGRPKLGVTAREVTLLPRHWEWLGQQPGGASVALRRLVEAARKSGEGETRRRQAAEALHRFMNAIAGDLPNFEESLRAFYKKDDAQFEKLISRWPADLRKHILKLLAQARQA